MGNKHTTLKTLQPSTPSVAQQAIAIVPIALEPRQDPAPPLPPADQLTPALDMCCREWLRLFPVNQMRKAMRCKPLDNPHLAIAKHLMLLPENAHRVGAHPDTDSWSTDHGPANTPGHLALFRQSFDRVSARGRYWDESQGQHWPAWWGVLRDEWMRTPPSQVLPEGHYMGGRLTFDVDIGFIDWWQRQGINDPRITIEASAEPEPSLLPPRLHVVVALTSRLRITTAVMFARRHKDAVCVRSLTSPCPGVVLNAPMNLQNLAQLMEVAGQLDLKQMPLLRFSFPRFDKDEIETAWRLWHVPIPPSCAPEHVCRWSADVIRVVVHLLSTGGIDLCN